MNYDDAWQFECRKECDVQKILKKLVSIHFLHFLAIAATAMLNNAFAANHATEMAPLAPGPYPVACTNIAQDPAKIAQFGGQASDYWEGNNGGYITQILAEPNEVPTAVVRVPNDNNFYPQTSNKDLTFTLLVCYPTTADNKRADYALPDGQLVPKMQRIGDKPLLPLNAAGLPMRGIVGQQRTQHPLLVFSHGLGSSPLDSKSVDFLVKLAAYGYIVAAPFHADARFSKIKLDGLSDVVYIIRNFDYFVELQALRPLSIKATIDTMLTHPDFGPRINQDQIGGIGGSMGGATMTWLAGANLTTTFPGLSSRATVQDPRIKAMVGYVPYAGQRLLPAYGDNNASAVNVKTPYLAIGGTADTTAPIYLMEQAMNNFQSARYFVALTDVTHGYEPRYADEVFGWSVTFFDAYLRGNASAMSRLIKMRNIKGGLDDNMRIDYSTPTATWIGSATVEETFNSQVGREVLGVTDTSGNLAPIASTPLGTQKTRNAFRVVRSATRPLPLGSAAVASTLVPVCVFSGAGTVPTSTTLLTTDTNECAQLKTDNRWQFLGTPFYLFATSNGQCADGLLTVTRMFNNKPNPADYQYRYSTSNSFIKDLVSNGWRADLQVMCAPI
jgi:predicted dienelactone hydrolase